MEPEELRNLNERAASGDAEAQFKLARLYEDGAGEVPANAEVAAKWYRKVGEQGHLGAQFRLGRCLWEGRIGLPADKEEAIKWLRMAAEAGHSSALHYVRDCEAAQESRELAKQAESGDREAQYKLACQYEDDAGEDSESAEKEAAKWFGKAAEQGHVDAQYRLGRRSWEGRAGLPADKEEAMKWFRKAAEAGHSGAVEDVRDYEELLEIMQEIARTKAIDTTANHRKVTEEEYALEEKEIHDFIRKLADHLAYELSKLLLNERIPLDLVNAKTGEIIIPANKKITKPLLRRLARNHDHVDIDPSPSRNAIHKIITQFEANFVSAQSALDNCRWRFEAELMKTLDNLIVDLNIRWSLHRELFQVDSHDPLFEKSGSFVWGILYDALIESVFMCVSRLFDASDLGGKENLSFAQILKRLPESNERTQIEQDYKRIKSLFDPTLKRWRNWKLSHNSLRTIRGIDPLPDVSYSELATLIDGINQLGKSLGVIARKAVQTYAPVASYGLRIPNQYGVWALIKVLEGGTERLRNKT